MREGNHDRYLGHVVRGLVAPSNIGHLDLVRRKVFGDKWPTFETTKQGCLARGAIAAYQNAYWRISNRVYQTEGFRGDVNALGRTIV